VYLTKSSDREHIIRVQSPDVAKDNFELPEGSTTTIADGAKVGVDEVLFIDQAGKEVKSKVAGILSVDGRNLAVIHESDQMREYVAPGTYRLTVKDGDIVGVGQALTEGNLNPEEILKLQGTVAAQNLILTEVQKVYSSQGAPINDRHIEVIVRQMFSKVRVVDPGDASFLNGETVDLAKIREANELLAERGATQIKYEQLLMGITKVSLHTDSWLSAASFQETTKVLISAAVNGQTDYLKGLKENVIIGKLIPAGTGFVYHRSRRAQPAGGEFAGLALGNAPADAVQETVDLPDAS
jgi:DNA-directed RNA polymerase subunit beta'